MELALAEYLSQAPIFVRSVEGVITHWTQGAAELYGYSWPEAQGRSSHELLQTRFPLPLEEIDAVLLAQSSWQGLLNHTRADGSRIWTESVWRLRRTPSGDEMRVVEINTDVTRRELLARELDHRLKNTLAVVQGMARLSFKTAAQSDMRRFDERLTALAQAHDLLIQAGWQRADLGELLGGVLDTFGMRSHAVIEGEPLPLSPNSVVAYSLAFHELTTNAIKHGALSKPSGRVLIRWERVGPARDHIHLIWREEGGPPVTAPERRGFGSTLIERAISVELGEAIELRFEPAGLVCEFDGPIQKHATV